MRLICAFIVVITTSVCKAGPVSLEKRLLLAPDDDSLCPYRADFVLLMDASSSIGPVNYEKMKDFLKGVVSHFDVGQGKVRVGLVTFNHGAKLEFPMTQYNTTAGILEAFKTIQDTSTGTTTNKALEMAKDHVFTPEGGDRPDVPNLALLLTDGRSTNQERTAKAQALLKETSAVRIFAVGIGNVDVDELLLIASDPNDKYYAYVDTFDKLADILEQFAATACTEITRQTGGPPTTATAPITIVEDITTTTAAPTTTTIMNKTMVPTTMALATTMVPKSTMEPTTTGAPATASGVTQKICPYGADVLILMDASSSIGPASYEKMKDFLKGVINHFDIGNDKVRIGLITFNFGAKIEYYLNTYSTKEAILHAFDAIQDTHVGTATNRALQYARDIGFTLQHGDRPEIPNIAILVTDGRSTRPAKTAHEQQLLKDTGARIFSIGIGWTDEVELRLIASEPKEHYFHYVKDFDGLTDILSDFRELACNEFTRPAVTIPQTSPNAPTTPSV